jgi:hypothetical protein
METNFLCNEIWICYFLIAVYNEMLPKSQSFIT